MSTFWRWCMSRYIVVYMLGALICIACIDWPMVHHKRERYLLGLFYNGYFTNCRDGLIYRDYVRRVFPNDTNHLTYMTKCPDL